jgi:hypothetical protein
VIKQQQPTGQAPSYLKNGKYCWRTFSMLYLKVGFSYQILRVALQRKFLIGIDKLLDFVSNSSFD